jgi:hypothetical protein
MAVKIRMMAMAMIFFVSSRFSGSAPSGRVRTRYSLKASEEAATGAEKPTKKETQPLKNPARGLNNRARNM